MERAELQGFAFSDVLLQWYQKNRRILPWREEPSPYHVWISEIMLQQTRVEAVKAYYERFLSMLPDIRALAEAEEDVYLKLWEGLGYYSRVRNLHKAAVQIMEEYGGRLPEHSGELLKIAGIGPYTSAAIASISYGERIPAIDGNLLRSFARITAYEGSIKDNAGKKAAFDFFLSRMPEESRGRKADPKNALWNPCGAFNQALMDLGATVCTPNGQPKCMLCPFSEHCEAHQRGEELNYPRKEEKKARGVEKKTVFLIRRANVIALRKRPNRGLLAGLYEFPNTEGHLSEEEAIEYVRGLGFRSLRIRRLQDGKHIFSHKEWDMIGYEILADELDPFYHYEEESELREKQAEEEEKTERKRSGGVFLAEMQELKEKYSIPSAFSVYTGYLQL